MATKTESIRMKKSKDTPGTVVYSTNESGVASRSIYVNKGTWEQMPDEVEVTVKPVTK